MSFNYPPALNHKLVTWFVGPRPPGNQNLVSGTSFLSFPVMVWIQFSHLGFPCICYQVGLIKSIGTANCLKLSALSLKLQTAHNAACECAFGAAHIMTHSVWRKSSSWLIQYMSSRFTLLSKKLNTLTNVRGIRALVSTPLTLQGWKQESKVLLKGFRKLW